MLPVISFNFAYKKRMDFNFNLWSDGILSIIRGNSTRYYVNNNVYNYTIEEIKSKTIKDIKRDCNVYSLKVDAKKCDGKKIVKTRWPKCNSKIAKFIAWV